MDSNFRFSSLINAVAAVGGVLSIGKSGGAALPEPGESDVDIYVFCQDVPSQSVRQAVYDGLGDEVSESNATDHEGVWGVCDFVTAHDTEVCLLYFTVARMTDEIEQVLRGERLNKEEGYFYPTGRCATLLSMHPWVDKEGFIAGMKERLSYYPPDLSRALVNYHVCRMNRDFEDFQRALFRKEVLFYHITLENALDHFLQALFAANRIFFSSRKRMLQYLDKFTLKPDRCGERLLEAVRLGSDAETLGQSYAVWSALTKDFENMQSQS